MADYWIRPSHAQSLAPCCNREIPQKYDHRKSCEFWSSWTILYWENKFKCPVRKSRFSLVSLSPSPSRILYSYFIGSHARVIHRDVLLVKVFAVPSKTNVLPLSPRLPPPTRENAFVDHRCLLFRDIDCNNPSLRFRPFTFPSTFTDHVIP